jgi:phage-related protein
MAADAKLIIKILTDASGASAGVEQAQGKFAKFNQGMQSMVGPAAAVVGGIALIGTAAINAASDTEQAMGGVEAVFGDSAGQIKQWASEAAKAAGLSESAYGSMATTMGAQLKNMGIPMEQVADKTGTMIQLGADLAAQFGGSSADAVAALSSALRGEADPAEKYGLALNTTAVNAELAAQGLEGLEGPQLQAAKAAAIMKLATEQAGSAVGAYARESDTLAGSQQTFQAELENTASALGESLLPLITPVVQALAEFARWVQANTKWLVPLVAIIGALAAGVLIYAAAMAIANIVTMANPFVLLAIAIVALIAGFIALVVMNEDVRNSIMTAWAQIAGFFMAVWDGIKAGWDAVVNSFQTGMSQIAGFFTAVWNVITTAWAAVVGSFKTGLSQISSFFSAVWSGIVAGWNAAVNAIRAAVSAVVSFFTSAWQGAVNIVTNIIRTLQGVFTSVFNAIMVPINAVVGAFNRIVVR